VRACIQHAGALDAPSAGMAGIRHSFVSRLERIDSNGRRRLQRRIARRLRPVLTSSWSKWLGIPVAVLGLACYAALATLSVLLGLRSVQANRWISTMFVMLSIAAAGVSLWLSAYKYSRWEVTAPIAW